MTSSAAVAPAVESLESRQLMAATPAPLTGAAARVPEARGYKLVYDLNVPLHSGSYNKNPVPYSVNNAAQVTKPFDRVAYYMELQHKAGGPPQWVYVSVDAFTRDAKKIGVPTASTGAFFNGSLNRMNVFSNVQGVTNGTNLSGGRIEFWPNSYNATNSAKLAGASSTAFDFSDTPFGAASGWGSMQIHNAGARQTLFAYNDWGGVNPTQFSEVGVGTLTAGNPDWTGHNTASLFSVRRMQVLVRPSAATAAPARPATPAPAPTARGLLTVLPLGDSITWGFEANKTATGGYRSKLYQGFAAGGQKINFVGSVVDKYSRTLIQAGEANHEGHGGYRIDQISANFDGVGSGTAHSSNNGGRWINGTGTRQAVRPDVVLLHAGTNDALQKADAATMGRRMDVLLSKITTARPRAALFVSSIVPINDPVKNKVVQAYNNQLKNVLVPKYQKMGRNVTFVDQYRNFVDGSGKIIAARLPDKVHPDRVGYDLMAATWQRAIQQGMAKLTVRPGAGA